MESQVKECQLLDAREFPGIKRVAWKFLRQARQQSVGGGLVIVAQGGDGEQQSGNGAG